MASILPNFEYDIFISYRHNDNLDGWVTQFVENLEKELRGTLKETLTIYFDKNPHDGLQQHHEVDDSLRQKLKSLILIPIISQTYCDPKAFAWAHELIPFIQQASEDSLGLKTKVSGGNIASRVLPVRIHDIDNSDKRLFEEATGSVMRSIDFIYKESGVNRPLRPTDDRNQNQERTDFRNQVNKVANAIKEILTGLRNQENGTPEEKTLTPSEPPKTRFKPSPKARWKPSFPRVPMFSLSLTTIVLAIGFAVISSLYFLETTIEIQTIRYNIPAPEGTRYREVFGSNFELSPDGKLLAYAATDSAGISRLWVRPLNSLVGQAFSGTEDAMVPFWSPDSRFIGFFAGGKLKKIELSSGAVQTICDAQLGRGGNWNADGTILFTPRGGLPLYRVSASGGTPIRVTKLDSTINHKSHRSPYFLPDGKHFLYLARTANSAEGPEDAMYVGSLDTTFIPKLIMPLKSSLAYVNRHIVYLQGRTLMAQPFNVNSFQTEGDAIPIAENISYDLQSGKASFSISQNGLLAYRTGMTNVDHSLVWRDRNSKVIATIERRDDYGFFNISPDGKRVIASIESNLGDFDIWLYEIDRSIWTRFTFDATTPQNWPIWSPDGNTVIYSSVHGESYDLFQRPSDGSAVEKLVLESNERETPSDWSPDGAFVIYEKIIAADPDLWVLPMTGKQAGKPFPFLVTSFNEESAKFSPDGRWIAYSSNESGRSEIYIRPFQGAGGKWQVSTGGGLYPHWGKDGKEIFYRSIADANILMAVEVKSSASAMELGTARRLVQSKVANGPWNFVFAVGQNGDRFLFKEGKDGSDGPITIVTNWPEAIKKK